MNHDYINQSNLIDQYVLGKLTASEAEEFEDHFIDCTECVEQLNIARSFIQDLKGFVVQEALLSGKRPASVTRPWHLKQLVPTPFWAVASCCGLVVVALLFAFFTVRRLSQMSAELRQAKEEASAIRQQYQRGLETAAESENQHQQVRQQLTQRLDELERKLKTEGAIDRSVRESETSEINFPIFALISVRGGQGSGPVEIAPPASSSRFALSIPVEDRRNFSVYRITIMNHQGTTVWKQSGFRPDAYHTLSLSLKSNFLTPGSYDLKVEGLNPTNNWDTVGNFPFRIAKRR